MKLLVISHNAVSRHNAMGKTISAFLAAMQPEEVCQLYIHPASPCEGICGSFYRITDKDMLKSWLGFGPPGGERKACEIGHPEGKCKTFRNRNTAFRLAREILWSSPAWFSKDLKRWLDREKPDCIFAAGGDAAFLYQIALKLSREYALPIVAYLCDEYYFLKLESGAAGWIWYGLRKRKMEAFLNRASHAVVISQEMREAYVRRFSLPVTTIMTGSSGAISVKVRISEQITHLTYMGNLSYGRYRSLAAIGKALETVNQAYGTQIRLDIYSAQNDRAAQAAFDEVPAICFHGFLTCAELETVMDRAQLLVHVEDFSPRNQELVKHSVSTKISDSLASGIPLFAYGPARVASMAYLRRNRCAITVVEEDSLKQKLAQTLFDKEIRLSTAENGLKAARQNHDRTANSQKLREILENAVSEGKSAHEIAR